MKIEYALYVRYELYQRFRSIRGASRERILSFVEGLAANPFVEGDYVERDSTGRECQVRIIGKYAVLYWPDHAEKEVRIVDLIEADSD